MILEAASEEMQFGTVNRWYRQEGEEVADAEALVEIEAEKAAYDVLAPVAGLLSEVLAMPGDEVPVGAVLATIEPA